MTVRIIFYVSLTLFIDLREAADPWSNTWVSPENETIYKYEQNPNGRAGEQVTYRKYIIVIIIIIILIIIIVINIYWI